MFLGIKLKSLYILIFSTSIISLIGAFVLNNTHNLNESFLSLFLLCFIWLFILGMVFFQEKISGSDYEDIMETNSAVPQASELSAVIQFSVWTQYWYKLLRIHQYIVLMLIQTLFIVGFYLLTR